MTPRTHPPSVSSLTRRQLHQVVEVWQPQKWQQSQNKSLRDCQNYDSNNKNSKTKRQNMITVTQTKSWRLTVNNDSIHTAKVSRNVKDMTTVSSPKYRKMSTRGVTGSMSAFLACHQCYCAGSSLAWGLNLRAVVYGIFWSSSPEVFSGYSDFLPSFIGLMVQPIK